MIARFANVLQQVILLASFMPVISAISGNVGLQAAAIVVRGLDTGHVSLKHWGRQVAKELSTSFLLALACGAVLGAIGAAWSGHLPFGLVIGGALTCSMLDRWPDGQSYPDALEAAGLRPGDDRRPVRDRLSGRHRLRRLPLARLAPPALADVNAEVGARNAD